MNRMQSDAQNALLMLVLLLNFSALGTSRLRAVINAAALQGVLLGAIAILAHHTIDVRAFLIAGGAALIKGFVIPWMLLRAIRDVSMRREVEPLIGYVPSLLLGALATGVAVVFARTLPLVDSRSTLLVPASLATVLTGFIILTTRRKAITQVAGYLILENGIFIMGLTLVEAMPFLVEVGVLLDLVVGIFVMGIIVYRIQREFDSLDTDRLADLKE